MAAVVVIDVLAAHDRVRSRHRFEGPDGRASCTIGRGAAADVIVDDPHVAPVHARVTVNAGGEVTATDLGSVNGVEIGGCRLHGCVDAPLTDGVLRIGRTRLRVRTAQESIPAETPERGAVPGSTRARDWRAFALGFALTLGALVLSVWTATVQSRELATAMIMGLLVLLVTGGTWIALWALVTRVAFGESRWLRHAAIFFCAVAAIEVASMLLDLAAGSLGLYLPSLATLLVFGGIAAAALAAHLLSASQMQPRFAIAVGILLPALALGAAQWTWTRSQDRSANYIPDRNQILPPALVLRHGAPLAMFAAGLDTLAAQADGKRAFVEKEDPAPAEEPGED